MTIKNLFSVSTKLFLVSVFMFISTLSLTPAFVAADAKSQIQVGVDQVGGGATPAQQAKSLNDTIAAILNVISTITGVIAVIMIIVAGFRYVTSGGASDKVTSAKNTVLYAVIGLVVVALAQIIVKFVLNKATVTGP